MYNNNTKCGVKNVNKCMCDFSMNYLQKPFFANKYGIIVFPENTYFTRNGENDQENNNQEILNSIAMSSYVYGFPLVITMIDKNRKNLNKMYIINTEKIDEKYNHITANGYIDLSNGPVLIRIPEVNGVEYTVDLRDSWTNAFADFSTKTTGNKKEDNLIVGPNWKGELPDDINIVLSPTDTVLVNTKIKYDTDLTKDITQFINNFEFIQIYDTDINKKYDKNYLKEYINNLNLSEELSAIQIVQNLTTEQFFKIMTLAMYYNPNKKDVEMNRKLAILGIYPSLDFDYNKLESAKRKALEFANRNGYEYITKNSGDNLSEEDKQYLNIAKRALKIFV